MKITSKLMLARRISLLVLVLCMMFSFSACKSNNDTSLESVDVDNNISNPIDKTREAISNLKSISFDVESNMSEITTYNQSIKYTQMSHVDEIFEPMQLSMNATVTMNNNGDITNTEGFFYIISNDTKQYNQYDVYHKPSSDASWTKRTKTDLSEYNSSEFKECVNILLSLVEFDDLKKDEKIGDVDTVHYSGIVRGKNAKELLESYDALRQIAGVNASSMDDFFDDTKIIPVNFWISKDNYIPVRYDIDVTNVVWDVFKKSGMFQSGLISDVTEMKFTWNVTGINNVENITVPSEALSS